MRRAWWGSFVVAIVGCGADLRPRVPVPVDVPTVASSRAEPDAPAPATVSPLAGDDCSDDPAACVAAGVRLTRTDLASAARKFAGACEAGSPVGCGNYAVLLRDGRGVDPDPDRAEALMRGACDDGSARACDELRLR